MVPLSVLSLKLVLTGLCSEFVIFEIVRGGGWLSFASFIGFKTSAATT